MKILKGFMLTLLIMLCAAVTIAVFIHLKNNDGTESPRVAERTRRATASEELDDVDDVISSNAFYSNWQRSLSKPDGSDYWHFYPIIPDAQPGDTVVLNVSVENFKGWEADPDFVNVDLFDETFDEENAYISFIMPDKEVSIAALYTEIPYINYKQAYDSVSNYSLYEQGEAGDAFIRMPDATENIFYDMDLGTLLPAGTIEHLTDIVGGVNWDLRTDGPGDRTLPSGLFFERIDRAPPLLSTARIRGTPAIGTEQPTTVYTIRITYATSREPWTDPDTEIEYPGWTAGDQVDILSFGLAIWPEAGAPDFYPEEMPAAMVNVNYEYTFTATNLPRNTTWVWNVVGGLPSGMFMRDEMPRAVIYGKPTASTSVPFTITLNLSTPNPDYRDVQKEIEITIWPQPVITPYYAVPGDMTPILPLDVTAPAILYDGIQNYRGVIKDYIVRFEAAGVAVDAPSINWEWSVINGSLPAGVTLPSGSLASAHLNVSGRPTEAKEYSFTVKYTADQSVVQGMVERDITITILPPPFFITGYDELREGMDWRPRYEDEEPEIKETDYDFYYDTISVGGFNVYEASVPEVKWNNWSYNGDFPWGPGTEMEFEPVDETFAVISGKPQTSNPIISKDYEFNLAITAKSDNPNIDNAILSAPYQMRIWARRYLYIHFVNATHPDRYVRRFTPRLDADGKEIYGEGMPADVNWASSAWGNSDDAANYRGRRAIMPNERGEIRVPLGNSGFVRWEVRGGPYADPAVPTPNANNLVKIGGSDRYTANPGSSFAYLNIDMPDGDVYIQAFPTDQPVWTSRFNNGVVNDEASSGFVSFRSDDAGGGADAIRWERLGGMIPPGMDFMWGSNTMLPLLSLPGGPTLDGTYTFTLGIHLPGSMRLDNTFTMIIEPVPGFIPGDVNGDGQRNLFDLVLLARFVGGKETSLPNPEAGIFVRGTNKTVPNMSDLTILATYFARPDADEPRPPAPPQE